MQYAAPLQKALPLQPAQNPIFLFYAAIAHHTFTLVLSVSEGFLSVLLVLFFPYLPNYSFVTCPPRWIYHLPAFRGELPELLLANPSLVNSL